MQDMETKSNIKCFNDLAAFLNQHNIIYCVVGDSKSLPDDISGDIDIVISNDDLSSINNKIYQFSKQQQCNLVQILQHEYTAFYFVLSWLNADNNIEYLHPDICGDYLRNGTFMLSAEEILEGRIEATDDKGIGKGFYVPSPKMEFIYYLLKKIGKQELRSCHGAHLTEEWRKDPSGCMKQICRFWEGKDVDMLALAAESNEWGSVEAVLPGLRRSLYKTRSFSLLAWWRELFRKVYRMLQPTGLFIVILGPDGSGKSSVIKQIIPDLAPAFRNTQYVHLRPKLWGKNKANNVSVDDPHGQKARSLSASVAKIFYFLFDYRMGYLLKIRPMLVRSTFVVFDRYYYDLLIDPKRYRYAGPAWLARVMAKFVPNPDLLILLDAPAEVLQKRKQEVPYEETVRQREEYLKLVGEMRNGIIIDASLPLDKVVVDVNKAVSDYMVERMKKLL